MHNGVVRNTKELKDQHDKLGINYVSLQEDGRFNDSEALSYDIARYLEGDVKELTAAGSIAFIAIKRDNKGKPIALFFGRNSGNPLKMKRTEHSLTISSEGEGENIDINLLHCYIYETDELTTSSLIIPFQSRWTYPAPYRRPPQDNNDGGFYYSAGGKLVETKKSPTAARIITPTTLHSKEEPKFTASDRQLVKDQAEYYLYEADGNIQQARIDIAQEMVKINNAIDDIEGKFTYGEAEDGEATIKDLSQYEKLEAKISLLRACLVYVNAEEAKFKKSKEVSKAVAGFQGTKESGKKAPESSGGTTK